MFEADDAPMPFAPVERTGKAGRPKGARNRSTTEWVEYILGRHKSPLTVLAELYSRSTEDLVNELQRLADANSRLRAGEGEGFNVSVARISPLEVLKLQRDAAVALLPYIHKRQPMALEIDAKPRGIVVFDADAQLVDGQSDDLALPLAPMQGNQGVNEASPLQSDGRQSDDATNPLTDHDNRGDHI